MIVWSAIILIGIAVFIVARTIFQDEEEFKAQEKLEDTVDKSSLSQHGIVLKYARPFFKRYVTPIVSNLKNKKKIKDKYQKKLANAGLLDILTPEDFFSFKLSLIIGFPVVFLAVRFFLEETWPLSSVPLISLVGYFYPDIWVKGKIEQRQQDIIRNMPFAVDMLALSVEAGLDFVAAMQKVVDKTKKNPLSDEFATFIKEMRVGASRAEGLRNMSWRINMLQFSSFTATLIAADSVGASIGPILKELSVEIRNKRSTLAEKLGAQASTKILIPMMLFILPAVLLIVAGPPLLNLMSGGN